MLSDEPSSITIISRTRGDDRIVSIARVIPADSLYAGIMTEIVFSI